MKSVRSISVQPVEQNGAKIWFLQNLPSKHAEQVQMYYTPDSATDAIYDMKIVDGDGNAYEIYSVELGDMEKCETDDRQRICISDLYESQ